jgi:hypothetical protein
MSQKISKTRLIANTLVNPNSPGGKFILSEDSDAISFGNSNDTSIKFGRLEVGADSIRTHFTRTSRNLLFPLNNRPDSDNFNRFSSTNLPDARPFQDAIIGSDSDNSLTTFKGNFFLGEDINGDKLDDFTNRHRKFPLDSDSILVGGSQNNQGLVSRGISRFVKRSGIIFGRKHGTQRINIARVSGENTPLQFGYPRTAGNQYDSENTVFTSFGTLDLQGRTLFKASDVIWGYLGSDSDADNGFIYEYNSSGNTGSRSSGMGANGGSQRLDTFFGSNQLGKSFVNMKNTTLTGTGTFKFNPIHNSSGTIVNKPQLTVSDIRDSDGTLTANHSGSGHNIMTVDSDGFNIGSTNVSIPTKMILTVQNVGGSTVQTVKFIDPNG